MFATEENGDQKTVVDKNLFFKHFFTIKKTFFKLFLLVSIRKFQTWASQ
jgi:hypothetical protein